MIHTRDLLLRPGEDADWKALYHNLWSREEVFRHLFSRPCPDATSARKKTAAYAEMHRAVPTEFFVEERASGQVIGIAGVKELHPGLWTITDVAIGPDYQGQGYGRQIVAALAELAFDQGAEQVAYECFAKNEASQRLALACGFRFSRADKAELQKNQEDVTLYHYIRQR